MSANQSRNVPIASASLTEKTRQTIRDSLGRLNPKTSGTAFTCALGAIASGDPSRVLSNADLGVVLIENASLARVLQAVISERETLGGWLLDHDFESLASVLAGRLELTEAIHAAMVDAEMYENMAQADEANPERGHNVRQPHAETLCRANA